MDYAVESLKKHREWNGKIEVVCRAPLENRDDLSLAYTPGVAEPCLAIQKDVDLSYELTRRLTEKGAVRTEVRDGMHVYFPAVSREDAAARQTRDLLGRVYHGSLSLLVSAMTREEILSKAEIDELYAILDEMEAKQGDA